MFELLGQSVGDPYAEEDDIPVVMRSWQAQNFLLTALHVKGSASNINVLGVSEVQVCQCFNQECRHWASHCPFIRKMFKTKISFNHLF